MPLFFICFIVFALWFRVKMRKNNSVISDNKGTYWERESQANFARSHDINTLDYLSVNEADLPFSSEGQPADEEEKDLEQLVHETSRRKMINLSAYTNTELKEQYGIAHLEELTDYDQNYLYFIRALAKWGCHLYEKDDYQRAKQIMEYSLSIGSDISSVYITLGKIYAKEEQLSKIDALITTVEQSDSTLKASIIKQLTLCKLE